MTLTRQLRMVLRMLHSMTVQMANFLDDLTGDDTTRSAGHVAECLIQDAATHFVLMRELAHEASLLPEEQRTQAMKNALYLAGRQLKRIGDDPIRAIYEVAQHPYTR